MNIFDFFKKEGRSATFSTAPEYIAVFLGNPGKEYAFTRHNAGFMAADYASEKLSITSFRSKFSSLCATAEISGKKVILLKPQTFMNNSGIAVKEASDYYKIPPERIIVVFDDVNIAPGTIRVKRAGTDGGHNGIKSIIYHLSSNAFPRIKIGIGKPIHGEMIDWVIGPVPKADREDIFSSLEKAYDALVMITDGKIDDAMAKYNRK